MCMACDEMSLFYAYLDEVAEAKRKAQPWECEVTVFPQAGDAASAPAPVQANSAAKSGFACDETE
jgi:hypothetical protein